MSHYIQKLKLTIQISSVMACFSALAVPGPTGSFGSNGGIVWATNVSGSITVNEPSSSSAYNKDSHHWAAYFGLGLSQMYKHDCLKKDSLATIDSYSGIRINENIIIVVQGTAAGTLNGDSDIATGIWDSNGIFSTTQAMPQNSFTWCGAYQGDSKVSMKAGDYANFTGTIALYVRKNVPKGTYTFPDIRLYKGQSANAWETVLVRSSTFTISDPTACTISPPPEIAFGDVNLWDFPGNTGSKPGGNRKDVLGAVDGSLTVDCTGSVPAKLTLQGTTQVYANDLRLIMDTDGSLAPATVRASIKNIHSPCSSSGIYFTKAKDTDTSTNTVDINLQQGINTIPYRFSLCSLGEGYKQGSASGTATITLDWD